LAESVDAYVKREYDVIHEPYETDNYDCMLIQLEKLDFYHKPLVIDYFLNGMTYTKMFEKYKISIQHLKQAIEEGLETIRIECKKQLEQ
jgi:wyosine [tRNA(Phe)-imidazoG37] synthetase (radical SAM superfamily)